jgi:sulfate adenylyltransferase
MTLARPLVRSDIEHIEGLRRCGHAPLVLVPAAAPTPDGVPYQLVLRHALRQVQPLGVPVIAVSMRWRGVDDKAVADAVARAYGAEANRMLGADDEDWKDVRAALDTLDWPQANGSPSGVDDATWSDLLRWRRPPSKRGLVVMFTGLSGSGKSTLARALSEYVQRRHRRPVTLLDGDVVRRLLSSGLGFDRQSRETNIRRLGWVASEIARHGGVSVMSAIAPYHQTRAEVREMVAAHGDLVLVHVATPLAECERRDRKSLYARARRGEISDFTGIDAPYEVPVDADVTIDTTGRSVEESLQVLLEYLGSGGWLPQSPGAG